MKLNVASCDCRGVTWCYWRMMAIVLSVVFLWGSSALTLSGASLLQAQELKVGYFDVDASPSIGSPLAYDPCVEVSDPLSCRGVVIVGAGKPIVLVTIDWLGVANDGHEEFRRRLAESIGSQADRISLHALHQHDAPRCDLGAMRLLEQAGCTKQHYDRMLWQRVLEGTMAGVKEAIQNAQPFDQVG